MASVEIPLEVVLGVPTVLGGVIAFLFRMVVKLQDALLLERQGRLTFVESKLELTEKREAESAEREKANASMLADLVDLSRAQTSRGLREPPPRRPGSLPGR